MASFAPNNTPFDVQIFKAILAGLYCLGGITIREGTFIWNTRVLMILDAFILN